MSSSAFFKAYIPMGLLLLFFIFILGEVLNVGAGLLFWVCMIGFVIVSSYSSEFATFADEQSDESDEREDDSEN